MTQLETFRTSKDEFFASESSSPLENGQKEQFQGLSYFPENPELRLEGSVEEFPVKESIDMQTSTGDRQTYTRFGLFVFSVEGEEARLTIYSGPNNYFLPFVDSLAGTETYGAGRYLEPVDLDNGNFSVDFNLAYNPYCAYNERWSCPIPPRENRLKVPIRAGERIFKA
jgi:hypothetical protein